MLGVRSFAYWFGLCDFWFAPCGGFLGVVLACEFGVRCGYWIGRVGCCDCCGVWIVGLDLVWVAADLVALLVVILVLVFSEFFF